MRKHIGVIEQLSDLNARPTYHVNSRIASHLIESGQAIWAEVGHTLRKTPKHGRLSDDSKLMAGRAFAVRGLSAQVGAPIAEATHREADKWWAGPMLEQIKDHRLPQKSRRMWRNHSGERSSGLILQVAT